jgi:hypothetical protein
MKKQECKGIVHYFACEFFAIMHMYSLSFVFIEVLCGKSNHTVDMTPPEIICSYIFYTRYLKMFQMEVVDLKEIGISYYACVCPPVTLF